MRPRSLLTAVALAALLVPAAGLAGQTDEDPARKGDGQLTLLNASELLGQPVVGRNGQRLGTLAELVTDPRRHGIAYAVLDHDGDTGGRSDLFAIPWPGFTITTGPVPGATEIVLDADRSRIERAQRYDDDWPHTADPRWIEVVYAAFASDRPDPEQRAAWREKAEALRGQADTADFRGRRLSALARADVACGELRELGEVEHLVVDLDRGHLAWVIVDVDGKRAHEAVGAGQLAVPWRAMQVRGPDRLHCDAGPRSLARLAYRPEDRWKLADRDHAVQWHGQLQLDPYWVVSVWVPERYQVPADRMAPERMSSGELMTVVGQVTSVDASEQTMTLHLATGTGKTYVVDAGASGDLDGMDLARGDHVAVRGHRPDTAQKRYDLVAHVVSKDDRSVEVAAAATSAR